MLEAILKTSPGVLSAENLLEQASDEHTDPFIQDSRRFGDQTGNGVGSHH